MDYSFSTITGVLPLRGPKRTYAPRAARPHMVWVCDAHDVSAIGRPNRLTGDGPQARLVAAEQREPDSTAGAYGLRQLLTVDGEVGTRVVLYRSGWDVEAGCDTPGAGPLLRGTPPVLSTDIVPSQRKIVALLPTASSQRETVMPCSVKDPDADDCAGTPRLAMHERDLAPICFASDDVGNVYRLSLGDPACESKLAAKKARTELGELRMSNHWTPVASAHSSMVSTGSCGEVDDPFAVARGSPGWAGLAWTHGGGQLVSVREFYFDVRVHDVERREVVRSFGTTHSPTGVLAPAPMPYCVLVAEGCLASLYDIRAQSAVLTLKDIGEVTESCSGPSKTLSTGSAASEGPPPLIPGRLTSTAGVITDLCSTVNPSEVALSIDRALCVYDCRKFSRLFTSANVLKYSIASIAATAGGRAIVCGGTDTEVRIIPLCPHVTSGEKGRMLSSEGARGSDNAAGAKHVPTETDAQSNTFRTRLDTSICCATAWQGGWVTAVNAGGAAAVGISIDNEVFLAQ